MIGAYDVIYLMASLWIIFFFLKPTQEYPPLDKFEIVAPFILLHVIVYLITLPLAILCYFANIGPVRFLLWFVGCLTVYMICNHFENRALKLNYYRKIPGIHTSAQGAHWFWGDMMNMRKRARTFLTEDSIREHKIYGPVVAVSPTWFNKIGQVKVTDPADVQFILKDEFENFIKPPIFKEMFFEILGDGIFISQHAHTPDNGRNWKLQRKISSNIFTSRNFRENFCTVFVAKGLQLLKILENAGDNVLDWQKLCSAFTLESIGEIGFGVPLHCLDSYAGGQAIPFATAFDRASALCMLRIGTPAILRWLPSAWKSERELQQCVKTMDELTSKLIEDRRKNIQVAEGKADLLSLFMTYREDEQEDSGDGGEKVDTGTFSDKFLQGVVMSFFIAGRDTTASVLTFAFWLLAQNPAVLQELLAEIDAVCPKGTTPTYEMVKGSNALPYLDGVIKETLRIFPAVPMDPKFACKEMTLPSGYTIPPRCIVYYSPYVMGRSPELYNDPLVMDPTRWIGQPEPSHYRFPNFQAGKRICLGMSMAYIESKLLAIMVLQHFTLSVVSPKTEEEMVYGLGITLSLDGGLQVKVHPRK